MKALKVILFISLIALGLLIGARNVLVERGVERAIEQATGFDMRVGDVQVGLLKSAIRIDDFKLLNPPSFPERVAMEVDRIMVDYNLASLFSDRIELSNIELEIPRFVVVKPEKGESNTQQLRRRVGGKSGKRFSKEQATKDREPGKAVYMKRVKVNLGKVEVHDYSKKTKDGQPVVKEYTLNVDREFKEVDGIAEIAGIIASDILMGSLSKLGMDFRDASTDLPDERAELEQGAKRVAKDASAGLGGLLEGIRK